MDINANNISNLSDNNGYLHPIGIRSDEGSANIAPCLLESNNSTYGQALQGSTVF